jgi:predicted transcriptional regulator
MEIRLPPDKEAHLVALAASVGRSTDQIVEEAVELWEERENERALAEFRASLDEAEASIARGEGIDITPESMRQLSKDVMERCRIRLEAERKANR